MESLASDHKAIGLVIDVSLRHTEEDHRIVDVVKKQLIAMVKQLLEDGEDHLYLYHPLLMDSMTRKGEQYCAIGNYESDGWRFHLFNALSQTLHVLWDLDPTLKKTILLVTDRLTDPRHIEKALFLNDKDKMDIHLVVVGVGSHVDGQAISGIQNDHLTFIQIDSPHQITPSLFEVTTNAGQVRDCETC